MSADSRLAVLRALEEGKLMKEVARQFGVSKSIISRIYSRYRLRNNVERLSGSGHRRKTTVRQDRQMLKTVKLDPRKTAADVKTFANKHLGVIIGVFTARNRLREANLFARRPVKKPLISKINKKRD